MVLVPNSILDKLRVAHAQLGSEAEEAFHVRNVFRYEVIRASEHTMPAHRALAANLAQRCTRHDLDRMHNVRIIIPMERERLSDTGWYRPLRLCSELVLHPQRMPPEYELEWWTIGKGVWAAHRLRRLRTELQTLLNRLTGGGTLTPNDLHNLGSLLRGA